MKIIVGFSLIIVIILTAGCAGTSTTPKKIVSAENEERQTLSLNRVTYTTAGKTYYIKKADANTKERGKASWYGQAFHGRRTASGEIFNMHQMTAAHPSAELPLYMCVTNLNNGKTIIVRVNDRMPRHRGRVIDLSYAAAKKLAMHRDGLAPVEIQRVYLEEQN